MILSPFDLSLPDQARVSHVNHKDMFYMVENYYSNI